MSPQSVYTLPQQRALEYAAYVSYISKLYAAIAGPDGIDILKKLFPESPINPKDGLMRPFCPETADVVHDFLRTGLIAPVDLDHGYNLSDGFRIASEDHLDLNHTKYFDDNKGNWQIPPHHSIQQIPEPTKKHIPPVPPELTDAQMKQMGEKAVNDYIDKRNIAIGEENRVIQENETAELNYFETTIASSTPSDVNDILNAIKSYIEANPIGGKYRMGHVVVHGIRDSNLTDVNRSNGTQHFFIIMLYEGDLYLVDAMAGYKVLVKNATNLSTKQSYRSLDYDHHGGIDSKGPTVTKDLNIIRSYFRAEGFKNIRYTKTFDAVRASNVKRARHGGTVLGETGWGVPSFAKKRPNDYFDIDNPLLLQPCALYGFAGM